MSAPQTQDDMFVRDLTNTVTKHPDWELDAIVGHLIELGFPRPYVTMHMQAIYAAMLKQQRGN